MTDNALQVLKQRYFREGEDWNELCLRVVNAIMPQEDTERCSNAFAQIHSRRFLPNTPALINTGKENQMLFACFVLPIEDSMDGIFTTIKNMAMIQKDGGGTGFSFGGLREKGARVQSTNGESSGVVSFMEVFNASTNSIKQGGVRRGANMAVLPIHHPEIVEFIKSKEDVSKLTNFNISVGITDAFMTALQEGTDFDLVSPHTNKVVKTLPAKELFNLLIEQMHKTGEPGILFLDEINRMNPNKNLGEIEASNPCGESPLLPYESCVLGSIDVAKFYDKEKRHLDFDELRNTINIAVDFLDRMIDVNHYTLPEISEMTKKTRKIGLGVMGWADLLYQMRIPYGSLESLSLANKLMRFITNTAMERSWQLGHHLGAYPEYVNADFSVHKKFTHFGDGEYSGLRNAFVTIIAPTGSLSIIADTSSGIEPNFALAYNRRTDTGLEWKYFNKHLEDALKEEGIYSEEIVRQIEETGSVWGIKEIPNWMKNVFVTSHNIEPRDHINMQSAFQQWTTGSISKTINIPNEENVDEIRRAVMFAWESGCKGVTVYRDGCRPNQILTTNKKEHQESDSKEQPRMRPLVTSGRTHKIPTACGNLYVTANRDEKGLCEVFVQMGKGGNCAAAQLEAIARLISLCLRADVDIKIIIKQIDDIKCTGTVWYDGKKVHSCADAIAVALKDELIEPKTDIDYEVVDYDESVDDDKEYAGIGGICPDCGNILVYAEGCMKCQKCGWSKC